MDVAFGYYPSPLSLSVGDIDIRALPGLEETVALVGTEGVEDGWVYVMAISRLAPLIPKSTSLPGQ